MKRHTTLSDVIYLQAREIRITCPEAVPVQLDGELATELPVTFRIAERRLRVLAPPCP
jgi:diacylglycerol kinase family enzyme